MTKLTLKDIIEILIRYDIRKVEGINNRMAELGLDIPIYYGLSDDYKKEILIEKYQPDDLKRLTMVHELHHCYHYMKGDLYNMNFNQIEKIVDRDSKLQTKELYLK